MMRHRGNKRRQEGSVLLAMMLVLVVSASYMLVSKLNENTRFYTRQSASLAALNQAKAALIGYAARYPDRVNPNAGPGYLPCPDLDSDGVQELSCALTGPVNFTIGRFPFQSLDSEDLRDVAGERLWYALSDTFRGFNWPNSPVNSDSTGQLKVNGADDIVALIIAPGNALDGQDRKAGPEDPVNYLEADNNDRDVDYVTRAAGEFNDVVVTITRQELMRAVEKRVLGEVAQAFSAQQTAFGAFPWLSPFNNPSTAVYRGQTGTRQGLVPFHWAADPDSVTVGTGANIAGRNPFSTMIAARWDNINGATTAVSNPFAALGFNTVSTACLNDIDSCDGGGIYPVPASLSPPANIDCTWSDRDTADCNAFTQGVSVPYTSGMCPLGALTRTYTLSFPAFTGNAAVVNPTAADIRRRDVSITAAAPSYLPAQANAISISDTFTGQIDFFGFFCIAVVNLVVGTGTSTFDADTEGSLAVNGQHYDVDIDAGELPSWFTANGWHQLIYLGYASGEPLPGDTTANQDCVSLAGPCLAFDDGLVPTDIRAMALSAGRDLTASRPSAALGDYFELDNSDNDDVFSRNPVTLANNDQTRIIATAP